MGEGRYRHLSFEEREQIAVWRLEGVSQAEMARRLARSQLTNVRLVEEKAEVVVGELLPDASVAAVWVNFPDPWPKKRHHKRRFFKPEVVQALTGALQPSGLLLVKSDHEAYSDVIADVLAAARQVLANGLTLLGVGMLGAPAFGKGLGWVIVALGGVGVVAAVLDHSAHARDALVNLARRARGGAGGLGRRRVEGGA